MCCLVFLKRNFNLNKLKMRLIFIYIKFVDESKNFILL